MLDHFGGRPNIGIASVGVCLALTMIVPAYAQSAAPGIKGVWTAGPGASGPDTYVGMIEAPRPGARLQPGAGLLVSGWAADMTATDWSGVDQVQVYNGDRTKDGKKLADGIVGLSRPDVADSIGANFIKSGFSATAPASELSAGPLNLYVYMHTPDKGWWYRTVPATVRETQVLAYPADPVVVWTRPCCGETITSEQFGTTAEYRISGYALDRNPNPNGQPKGPGNVGISSVTLYMDKLPGEPDYDPSVNLLGGQSGGPASPAVLPVLPSDVVAGPNAPPCQFKGSRKFCQADYSLTNAYGPEYAFAGWVAFWNQRVVQPDMFHTLYAVAKSSITGKTNTAAVDVYVKSYSPDSPPCGLRQQVRHQCAYRSP